MAPSHGDRFTPRSSAPHRSEVHWVHLRSAESLVSTTHLAIQQKDAGRERRLLFCRWFSWENSYLPNRYIYIYIYPVCFDLYYDVEISVLAGDI